jgi:O-antigen ligase
MEEHALPNPIPAPAAPARLQRAGLWALALGLVAVTLTFYTGTQDQFELPKQLMLRAVTSLALGLAAAWMLASPGLCWRRTPLDLPVLAWSLWLLVCTVHSVSPSVSWRGEYENFAGSLTQLNYTVAFFLAVQLAAQAGATRLLAKAMLAAATGAALYAAAQGLQRDLVAWSAGSVVSDRFFGPLGNPNFLAGLMAMAIPLKLALAYAEQRLPQPRDHEGRWRWALLGGWILAYGMAGRLASLDPFSPRPGADALSAVALGLWLAALLAEPLLRWRGRARLGHGVAQGADLLLYLQVLANTGTRGGFLGLMAGLAVLVLGALALRQRGHAPIMRLLGRAAAGLAALSLLLGLVVAGLGPSFRTRVLHSLRNPGEALEQSRLQIWGPALKIWEDRPLAGSGVDTFKTIFPAYASSRFNHYDGDNVSSRMAHCEPLQVLATQGAIGLALWLALLGALTAAAWSALRRERDEAAQLLLLGLAALAAAYLAQNLVSFGVAAISLPFWLTAGLLALAASQPPAAPAQGAPRPLLGLVPALLVGGLVVGAGLWLDGQTLQADLDFAFANQAVQSLPTLEHEDLDSCRGALEWGLNEAGRMGLSPSLAQEAGLWGQAASAWEQQLAAAPARGAELLPLFRRGAEALMMIVAAGQAERAAALCPDEVKYRLYVGLAYEELARRTPGERQSLWFDAAEAAYQQAVALNPQNAYYRGNLGRLYGMAADQGDRARYALAMQAYQQAIDRAPASKLFYENALLLQAHYADLDGAQRLLDRLRTADPYLSPTVHLAAASTFLQWRNAKAPAWTAPQRQRALGLCADWALVAQAQAPADADTALAASQVCQAAGRRDQALRCLREALRLRPGFPEALSWAQAQRFKP